MLKDKTICQFLNIKVEKGDKPFIITHKGKEVYREYHDGSWRKWEYDSEGRGIYHESSYGTWWKCEHDSNGNETYYENSNGVIIDNRPKELTMVEIAEKFGISVEQLKIKKDQ